MNSQNDTTRVPITARGAEGPKADGLYDQAHEHESCGVGFLVHLKGQRSHKVIDDGITALEHLEHRGACGCEVNTGDGAGILIQVPHDFFSHVCRQEGIRLPAPDHYGVGLLFAPKNKSAQKEAMRLLQNIVEEDGQHLLGWRQVPTDNSSLGATAVAAEPDMFHVFIGRGEHIPDLDAFERRLFVIRRLFHSALDRGDVKEAASFYVPSLSA